MPNKVVTAGAGGGNYSKTSFLFVHLVAPQSDYLSPSPQMKGILYGEITSA